MQNTRLIIAWIWVTIPLGWGVYQSVNKSMPLLGGAPKASQSPLKWTVWKWNATSMPVDFYSNCLTRCLKRVVRWINPKRSSLILF